MGWWDRLKTRWLRGGPAGIPESQVEAEEERRLRSPDAGDQLATAPEEEVDEIEDRRPPPPDDARR